VWLPCHQAKSAKTALPFALWFCLLPGLGKAAARELPSGRKLSLQCGLPVLGLCPGTFFPGPE